MVLARVCRSVWVARTASHSLAPIPKGERAKGAMGRGVAVTADKAHAGLCEAELGTHNVHDPLAPILKAKVANAVRRRIGAQQRHLFPGQGIGDRQMPIMGWNRVVGDR